MSGRTRFGRGRATSPRAAPATVALVTCALLTAAGVAGCQRVGGPNVQLQRMMVQPRYEPYGPGPFFPDGKAMQLPPPGTVAREDAVGAAPAPAVDSATLALGRDRYAVACALCHGPAGFGGGPVAANLGGIPGLSLRTPAARALTPAQLFTRLGLPGDVRHARAHELSPAERWAVALYTAAVLAGPDTSAAARADSAAAADRAQLRAALAAELRARNGVAP